MSISRTPRDESPAARRPRPTRRRRRLVGALAVTGLTLLTITTIATVISASSAGAATTPAPTPTTKTTTATTTATTATTKTNTTPTVTPTTKNAIAATFAAQPISLATGAISTDYAPSILAGKAQAEGVQLSNKSGAALTLQLSAATGATAAASGDAYVGAFGPCSGTGCWVQGLPASVTLRAGTTQTASFTVAVPTGTADGQYLAAAAIRSAGNSASQVNLRITITVGATATVSNQVVLTKITAATTHSAATLYLTEHNTGRSIARAAGTVACATGATITNATTATKTFTYQFSSADVLAGDTATLPVPASGLPLGTTVTCRAQLTGAGTLTATMHVPGAAGSGLRLTSTELIALIAVVVLVLGAVGLFVFRRRRHEGGSHEAGGDHTPDSTPERQLATSGHGSSDS